MERLNEESLMGTTGIFWDLCTAHLRLQAYLQHPLEKGGTHFPSISYDSGFPQKHTDFVQKAEMILWNSGDISSPNISFW